MKEKGRKQELRNAIMVMLIALLGGFGGGVLSQAKLLAHMNRGGHQPTIVTNSTIEAKPNNPMAGTGGEWHGLSPLRQTWVRQLQSGKVKTRNGETTSLPSNKPILLTAYWCQYCHATLQLLNREHLLQHVQVVALGFDASEGGQPAASVTNLQQASTLYQNAMRQIGVPLRSNQILYAMPGTPMDSEVTTYPSLLVPHDGRWYYLSGYVDNPSVYERAIS